MAKITKQELKEIEKLETRDTKYCTACKKIKPLFEFGVKSNGRKFAQSHCFECCKEKAKERNIIGPYNITLKEYDKLLTKQNGRCAICGAKTSRNKAHGRFSIDHDHLTGKIRGLLCSKCNHGLGLFDDNPESLIAAAHYLTKQKGK